MCQCFYITLSSLEWLSCQNKAEVNLQFVLYLHPNAQNPECLEFFWGSQLQPVTCSLVSSLVCRVFLQGCTRTNHRVAFKSLMRPNLCCNYVAQDCVTFLHCAAVQRFAGSSKAKNPIQKQTLLLPQAPAPPHQDPRKEKSSQGAHVNKEPHLYSTYVMHMLAPRRQKLRKPIAISWPFGWRCSVGSGVQRLLCINFV